MTVVCAWCQTIVKDDGGDLTHSICEQCKKKILQEMDGPRMLLENADVAAKARRNLRTSAAPAGGARSYIRRGALQGMSDGGFSGLLD